MKKSALFLFYFLVLLSANAQVEVAESENDTTEMALTDMDSLNFSGQLFITDSYQLPAYELYNKEWNTDHVRIKRATIPFHNDTLKIVLLQNNSRFVFPAAPNKVCSNYGWRSGRMHTGTDYKQRLNDTIVSCFDGVVRMAKAYSGYGKTVVIRHFNGLETVYAHLNKVLVKPNQVVKAGQLIGLAGRTGRATTEHLHLEFRFMYEHFNPTKIVDFTNRTLVSDTLVLTRKDFNNGGSGSTQSNSVDKTTSVHVVRKGDTLYKIARMYGVSLSQLLRLNDLTEQSILSIGQKVKVR